MLEQLTPEVRHELVAARFAELRRSAQQVPLASRPTRSKRPLEPQAAEQNEAKRIVLPRAA